MIAPLGSEPAAPGSGACIAQESSSLCASLSSSLPSGASVMPFLVASSAALSLVLGADVGRYVLN